MKFSLVVILIFFLTISFAQNQNASTARIDTIDHKRDSLSYGNGDGMNREQTLGFGSDSISTNTVTPSTRKIVTPPTFTGASNEEGKIALDIWVDQNGNVVKVRFKESKSTSGSAYLIDLATRAAYTIKYDKKTGSEIEYVGYQVFYFTIN